MSKRLEMLEQVLAKGSTDPFHHYARAMELRSIGRREDAIDAFSAVAERFADYVPTYLMAAQLADELSRRELARDFCRRGIELATRKRDAHALSELQTFLQTLG
ncbi:MAG: tetratricopeptide repeat protein [Sandaracinaceae bacterium]|nr:tetratricopeptide repeat protein [Sandaracinaceae bacterium]